MSTDTEQILAAIERLSDRMGHVEQDISELRLEVKAQGDRLGHVEQDINELRLEVKAQGDRLDAEVRRWDDRFFQLSKDTLGFTRTVVITVVVSAAVVAVLIPSLKEILTLIVMFKNSQ